MNQMNFLPLATEHHDAFVIPNVSPVSSPLLRAKQRRDSMPIMGTDKLTPLPLEEDVYEDDVVLISTGTMPQIALNE
ncbi:uncharacterized protein J8A68_002156 [[Candida] subhashii]|uniref:Uncharacterized protein n=1 Tax=[Candida] subhashii TaxID=561895 RepID=A0A8J5QPZ3_9ASCO|nr:uncharacterized protein J8A68_002156 [[Candida] subhashii]KAG7664298.1 hypothetical protein J8A68_002156 [[Candida] subhashii]